MKKQFRIICIHGAGMNAGVFDKLVPHLSGTAVDAVSLPGHKDKEQPLKGITAMADAVRQMMAGDAPETNILLGHSMGALVAMEAATDPSVAAVILLGAAAKMPVNAELLQQAQDDPTKAQELVIKWSVFKENPDAAAIRTALSSLMQEPVGLALYHDLKSCNDYAGPRKIRKPALVISGDADKMASAVSSKDLALELEGSLSSIPACGHMPMLEKPLETAAEIRNFISTLAH